MNFMIQFTKCKFKGEYVQNLIKKYLRLIFNIDKKEINFCKNEFGKFLNIKINPNINLLNLNL